MENSKSKRRKKKYGAYYRVRAQTSKRCREDRCASLAASGGFSPWWIIAQLVGVYASKNPRCGGLRRADVEYFVPAGPLLVDFTVCNEQAKSYEHLSSEQLQDSKNSRKQAHYKDGLDGRRLKTFYISAQDGETMRWQLSMK